MIDRFYQMIDSKGITRFDLITYFFSINDKRAYIFYSIFATANDIVAI